MQDNVSIFDFDLSISDKKNLFLKRLKEIFQTSEDLNSHDNLFNLFYIAKYMLSLGDTKLIEVLLSQEYYLDTFGALECKLLPFHFKTFYIRRSWTFQLKP